MSIHERVILHRYGSHVDLAMLPILEAQCWKEHSILSRPLFLLSPPFSRPPVLLTVSMAFGYESSSPDRRSLMAKHGRQ
jgi:hypothetical protein